jgi:DNA-binding MarR family transcriptional regulator
MARKLVPKATREALERARRDSLGHVLFEAARQLDERALERGNRAPGRPAAVHVRPAHTRLFPHIDFEGVRITDLAAKVGVTKQAVQPLVAELADWGVVDVTSDPTDGRARLVRWTEAGVHANLHGLGVLAEFERELGKRIGKKRVAALRDDLGALVALLSRP